MSLDTERAIGEGAQLVLSRNGLLLVGTIGWTVAANVVALNSLSGRHGSGTSAAGGPAIGPAPTVPAAIATALILATILALIVAAAVALRTFRTNNRGTIPREFLTHNLGEVIRSYLLGWVIYAFVLATGLSVFVVHELLFALAVVPLALFAVGAAFWFVIVAVDDHHYASAYSVSWEMTRAHRIETGQLLVALGIVTVGLYGLSLPILLGLSPWLSLVGLAVVVGVHSTFNLATAARAYAQLVDPAPSTRAD